MNEIQGLILNIEPDQIVDRDEYVETISTVFKNSNYSNIIILMSESAVGKSSLVDKLIHYSGFSQEVIRVRTLPINNSNKIEEWEYITYIFNAINRKYLETNSSFRTYIYSLKNTANNKILINYILDILYQNETNDKKRFFVSFLYLSIKWILKLGDFDIEKLIEDNSVKGNRIRLQYIKYILKKHKVILSIDNIQNIDKQSLRELINMMNETKEYHPQFLFEYTISEEKYKKDCIMLAEAFKATNIKTQIIELEKIGKEYIVDIISKHIIQPTSNWNFNVRLQEKYEENNNGNIREIIDYSIFLHSDQPEEHNSVETSHYTLKHILSLPEEAKQLLSIVVCSNNSVNRDILEYLQRKIELDIDNILPLLIKNIMVKNENNNVVLYHATISDIWIKHSNYFNKYDNISYAGLEEYYLSIINNSTAYSNNTFDQAWISLIQIYSKIKSEKLVKLFTYIDIDYKNLISTENAWKYIQAIISVTQFKCVKYRDLYMNIIRYCFESELYIEGYSVVEKAMNDIDNTLLSQYKAMYLSALDRHEENIAYCETMMQKHEKGSLPYYNYKLISLSSYRSLHKLEKCFAIHHELIKNKDFQKTNEWGFFLRLCEMYLDRNVSLHFLKKSVNHFEKRKDYIQAGKSLISYAFVLATQGKLKTAMRQIEKAEIYLMDKRMGRHMFLVNKAAIRILNGDYTDEVWEILNESEITAIVPFDKLAIIVNKLVWCIENKDTQRHELLISHALELLKKEPDKHIHGLIYYNIYYLLKKQKDDNYKLYLNKAIEMKKYCKPIKARLENKPTTETKYALKKPWHVCFLAYWTYDLL